VGGADALLFVGDDAGDVFAIDAATGNTVWGPMTPLPGSKITGAPGALLVQYGGPTDVVVVGTRNDVSDTGALHTLRLTDGSVLNSFDGAGTMGPVVGTPVVDYANGRVYVASFSQLDAEASLWCVEVDGSGVMSACTDWTTPPNLGDVVTSPVLRGGRLYVSNTLGEVYSVDATTGTPGSPFQTLDGGVKGFLWPDRRVDGIHDGDLYFATGSKVWSIKDTAGSLAENWSWDPGTTFEPNAVLQWPQTNLLYVGGANGTLYELDFTLADGSTPPVMTPEPLGAGLDHIGAPTLDIGVAPPDVGTDKKMLLVGSESGVLYAVEVPLGP
jgi:outer membrane protein assembly factor BamB